MKLTSSPDDEALDEDAVARRAEDALVEEELQRALGFLGLLRHDDTLAGGEAVRLEDARQAVRLERAPPPRSRVWHTSASGVGMPYFLMNDFEKTFEPSSSAASLFGPKARRPRLRQLVDEAERERKLGADDGQVDLHRLGEVRQLDDVRRRRSEGRSPSDAMPGLPGAAEDLRDVRRLRELPDERVLAPPDPTTRILIVVRDRSLPDRRL